jgi:hypothetical protein
MPLSRWAPNIGCYPLIIWSLLMISWLAIQAFIPGDQTVRILQLIDKHDRVIMQWDSLELVDGKLLLNLV